MDLNRLSASCWRSRRWSARSRSRSSSGWSAISPWEARDEGASDAHADAPRARAWRRPHRHARFLASARDLGSRDSALHRAGDHRRRAARPQSRRSRANSRVADRGHHHAAVHHQYRLSHVDLSLIHISEPTRLGMISYAVFCLKKKKKKKQTKKKNEKKKKKKNTKNREKKKE